MSTDFDTLVVGAGVVGLAIARQLAQAGQSVLVLEKESLPGQHTSSHNSEVIHAGFYYPEHSLKARFCAPGRDLLYAYADAHQIPCRRCGKLVVASTADELPQLDALFTQARRNRILDLQRLDARAVQEMAPGVRCAGALWSPSTGIIDSHALLQSFIADLQAAAAVLVCNTHVLDARWLGSHFEVRYHDDHGAHSLTCRALVNAAGLWASDLAARLQGVRPLPVETRYARGNYFSYPGKLPIDCLLYPLPGADGLGIHLTLDLQGQARFGPDVEWLDADTDTRYTVNASRHADFAAAVGQYWPGLDTGKLQPAFAGVRPKAFVHGKPVNDFVIQGPADVGGIPLVQLFGIESPGLTSCLALALETGKQLSAVMM